MNFQPVAGGAEQQAAVLFTDIVDSTRLHDEMGDVKARRIWAEHDRAARVLVRDWRGREVGRSDGFLLLFKSADDALGFALGYHRATAALEVPFNARVGVHWGPVVLRENSAADIELGATTHELDGLALPTAARVMAAALGGQTLFSGAAVQALARVMAPARRGDDASAAVQSPLPVCVHASHGHWRLKGLQEPIELIEIAAPGAALLPPPDSSKAYRVVRRAGLWMPVRELPHNLGAEPDSFVGRDDALQTLAQALADGARLVTLLGIGGMGKTRLAQRYARGWLGSHPGGAWFCDLSAARGLDGIVHAVAQALDVPLGRADPVQQLGNAMAGRGECLIVLDNFEQVVRFADATVGAWLRSVQQASFIVTSREVLGVAGEQVQVLAPLAADEAQVLFRRRMQAAGLGNSLSAGDESALGRLVDLLDRLPLAIELAAARARIVPPAAQVERIGERFRLLVGRGHRHGRQATLRATLDWSWELLSPPEQSALAQLSVFEGGFTLSAAEAVIDLQAFEQAPWTADMLQSLVEKSLVRRLHSRRFDLLQAVHDYAEERLAELGGEAVRRHWRYFAGLSESQAMADRCVELDNLTAACKRAAADDTGASDRESRLDCAVRALSNTWAALRLVGPFRAAVSLAAPLMASPDLSGEQRACVHRVLGAVESLMGQAAKARKHYADGLALARAANHRTLQSQLQCVLTDNDVRNGQFLGAEEALESAVELAGDDAMAQIIALNSLGNLAMQTSKLLSAQAHFDRALALSASLEDRRWQGGLHGSLGSLAIMQGDPESARLHLQLGLQLAEQMGDRQWAGNAHCNLGLLLHEIGDHAAALEQLRAALRHARGMGHRRLEATSLCNMGLCLQALAQVEEAVHAFKEAVAVAHDVEDRRMEGQFRGYLGLALATAGKEQATLDCFVQAHALLGAGADAGSEALLFCQHGEAAATFGHCATALTAMQSALSLDATLELTLHSELRKAIQSCRDTINRNCS